MDTKQIMAKLDDAFKLHQKGDLAAAEKIYLEGDRNLEFEMGGGFGRTPPKVKKPLYD